MSIPRHIRAFTLFEVMISMLILAIAILSVALLLPAGLRAQESARFQAIAAVTALNLVTQYENARPSFTKVRTEGVNMTNSVWSTHEPGMYDIERYLSSSYHARNALVPVPMDIARRLDSADDEIQQLLDEGGYLYFPSPLPASLGEFEGSMRDAQVVVNVASSAVPMAYEGFDESQRLVIGFVGYAQQNAIPFHPMTVGPGREYYPTAPYNRVFGPKLSGSDMGLDKDTVNGDPAKDMSAADRAIYLSALSNCNSGTTYDPAAYQGNLDHAAWAYWHDHEPAVTADAWADYQAAFAAFADWGPGRDADPENPPGAQWHQQRDITNDDIGILAPKVEAYFLACEDLLDEVVPTFDRTTLLGTPVATSATTFFVGGAPEPWQVSAMRYYGHAAMWLSRFIGDATWTPTGTSGMTLSDCTTIHEHCLRWIMAYRAHRPYDYGAPRPFNSPAFLDMPLLQQDLFNGSGQWDPTDGSYLLNYVDRRKDDPPGYRIIAPQGCSTGSGNAYAAALNPVANAEDIPTNVYGNWWCHDANYDIYAERIAKGWGRSEHFNLNHRFDPAERCRQMVMWSVDWQRYQDAERAPAALTDASWYPYESDGTIGTAPRADGTHGGRPGAIRKRGRPEHGYMNGLSAMLNWKAAPEGYTSIAKVTFSDGGTPGDPSDDIAVQVQNRGTPAQSGGAGNLKIDSWLGQHGIDANGNNLFDRGSVPPSMRMRATEVARFNLYDARVWAAVRN